MTSDLDQRLVEAELLDCLAPDDPEAIASRRDLVWINALMFQSSIMATLLKAVVQPRPIRILEIGSGDGAFMLAVARHLAKDWTDVDLVMLDRIRLLTNKRRGAFAKLGWRVETVTADIFDWIQRPRPGAFDVVVANLFLHHFPDADLKWLLAALQPLAPAFVATEPSRNTIALKTCSLLRVLGVSEVTLHDAAASVRAGFAGNEITSLWPLSFAHQCEERRIGPFTHIFRAVGCRSTGAHDV